VDIIDLGEGKQRYAFFTNEQGGIMDDLMVANLGDHLFVVVNAACKEQDINHLQAHIPSDVELEIIDDRALLAIQGPKAVEVLSRFQPAVAEMLFMDVQKLELLGVECIISRSGYTGEDGYEISVPADKAEALGLGARDSLRLECGLCLYGHDLDETTTPVEASLLWGIQKVRRTDVSRKRVGLVGQTKAPVREGAELFDGEGNKVGVVTSGTAGPNAGKPVSMAYLRSDLTEIGTETNDGRENAVCTTTLLPWLMKR